MILTSMPCLYFIAAMGHSLKSLDLMTLKKLDSKGNIIPSVIKSDAISKSELTKFKIKITSKLVSNGVEICNSLQMTSQQQRSTEP